tara:strand:+ start:2139 stop:2477 length:339 start_codon:yes stop_codon:yes gene_type:complete
MNLKDIKNQEELKTYHYYDQPLIYSCKIKDNLYFVIPWGSIDNLFAYFETSQEELDKLEANLVPMKEFMRRSLIKPCFLVNEAKKEITKLSKEVFKKDCYPEDNVYLDFNNK